MPQTSSHRGSYSAKSILRIGEPHTKSVVDTECDDVAPNHSRKFHHVAVEFIGTALRSRTNNVVELVAKNRYDHTWDIGWPMRMVRIDEYDDVSRNGLDRDPDRVSLSLAVVKYDSRAEGLSDSPGPVSAMPIHNEELVSEWLAGLEHRTNSALFIFRRNHYADPLVTPLEQISFQRVARAVPRALEHRLRRLQPSTRPFVGFVSDRSVFHSFSLAGTPLKI